MYYLLVFLCVTILGHSDDGLLGKESTIAVLDLQEYYQEGSKNTFIEKVRDACHSCGFFALKNTKVNQQVIDSLYEALALFFAHEMSLKMTVAHPEIFYQRGYAPFGGEKAKGATSIDFKEFYSMGRDFTPEVALKLGCWANVFPEFMDFETPAKAFYSELEKYSLVLQEIFSLALNQEKDFLKNICEDGDSIIRMLYYPLPPSESGVNGPVVWSGAHTDIDAFTILPKATCEGLEVMDDKGVFQPVFVKEDAMIINVGDLIEAFSNGYFKSSVHRVMKPENMSQDRYSSVLFVHPRSAETIYPLPQWIEKTGGKAKYIKATRIELLMERLADLGVATDSMLKSLAETRLLERLMTVDRASPEAMRAIYNAGYGSDEIKAKLNLK
jgi:isopenicillin N synthase-like dioxygenase